MVLRRLILAILVFCSVKAFAEQAPGDRLAEILDLARGGASDLALQTMDAEQPAPAENLDEWIRWERERIAILKSRGKWLPLAEHLAALPTDLPAPVGRWIMAERATALLESGNIDNATELLRVLVWQTGSRVMPRELAHWRQLIVRAYLAKAALQDAQWAILRLQQDYEGVSDDWAVLRARLYLRSNRAADALALLASRDDPESQTLRLLASLRAETRTAPQVLELAIERAVNKSLAARDMRAAWLVAAEAARKVGNDKAAISALERALTSADGRGDGLFSITADDIWDAYLEYGESLGNELHLIIGNDTEWFELATDRERGDPVMARALYAVIALKSFDAAARSQAHQHFSRSLAAQKDGGRLFMALYLDSRRFENYSSIPPRVRYLLVEHVLQVPDIPTASQLMEGLVEPPPGTDPGEWYLRQARVFLLGGQADQGIAVLDELLQSERELDTARFLQVVFDLQTIERHQAALGFFDRLLERELEPQQRREILFWAADSTKALGRHLDAARLYMRSAILLDAFAMDPWAQTARYYAAEELAKAGMYGDARNLYQGLLNATTDPGRRAVLRNNIQQLMLSHGSRSVEPGISADDERSN